MSPREERCLGWLRARGPGLFTYRQLAEATGMTRDHAWIACLALAGRGDVDYVQWIEHYGTDQYELRSALCSGSRT